MSKRDIVNDSSFQTVRALHSGNVTTTRRVTSEELLAGQRKLVIEHSGEDYRLRVTNNGKLILTK